MPTISAPDLELLRQSYHKQTQYLSVFRPETVLTAKLNGDFDQGSMSINYDSGSGDLSTVQVGMTLIVDTDNGLERIRIRGKSGTTTSGTLSLAQNSIIWSDDQDLTIKQEYLLWPKLPRFIEDTEDGQWWKDYDIVYTNQSDADKTSPIVIMGHHRAKFRTGASVVFNLDGTDSYVTAIGGSIASYLWESTAGTIANTTSGTTTLTFTSDYPDGVIVSLTVTDSFGNSQKSHRIYFVHNPDPTHDDHPITDFNFESTPSCSWDTGGWNADIRVSENADVSNFPEGTLVLLWENTIFGSTEKLISPTKEVKLAGYIKSESIEVDAIGYKQTSFKIETIESMLSDHYLLSLVLEYSSSPSEWYQFNSNLSTSLALWFYWYWHSTLFDVADVFLVITPFISRYAAEFQEGNLYQAASNISEIGESMKIASNKASQLYVEIDLQLRSDTDRAAVTVVSEIETNDRQDSLSLKRTESTSPPVSRVFLSGSSFVGAERWAYESYAPGEGFYPFGSNIKQIEGQIVTDQADTNMKSGRALASANNTFKDVRVIFKGNWGGYLDIVPQEWWTLSLEESDTNRGIVWNNKKLVPRNISYRSENGVYFPEVSFEGESFGDDGVAGSYTTEVPEIKGLSSGVTSSTEGYITSSSVYTRLSGAATWTLKTAEATDSLVLDPYWKVTQATDNPESCILLRGGVGHIKRSVDAGTVWNDITPGDPPNSYGDAIAPTAADLTFQFIESDVDTSGTFFVAANWENPSGNNRSWLLKTIDSGVNWGYTSEWWLSGGLSSSDCIAAYQAVDATSFANSLINLSDPGTNDLVSSGSDPSLTTDGWVFTGTESIDSPFTPDETYSIFIAVSDLDIPTSSDLMAIAGTERAAPTSFNFYYSPTRGMVISIKSDTAYETLAFGKTSGVLAGVVQGTNKVSYGNGVVSKTAAVATFTASQPFSLGLYTGYGATIYLGLTGTIKAIAFYSRSFTEAEALAIQASMMALFGS